MSERKVTIDYGEYQELLSVKEVFDKNFDKKYILQTVDYSGYRIDKKYFSLKNSEINDEISRLNNELKSKIEENEILKYEKSVLTSRLEHLKTIPKWVLMFFDVDVELIKIKLP